MKFKQAECCTFIEKAAVVLLSECLTNQKKEKKKLEENPMTFLDDGSQLLTQQATV